MHPDSIGISNSLTRMRTENKSVKHAGGHFNNLLPYDLVNTDAVTGQPEGACRIKLTKLDAWPESLYLDQGEGDTAYELIDHIAKGKGAH
jgi:hypothetical protein